MAVLDGPDDIFGAKRRVAAEENTLAATHHCRLIDDRAFPFVEFDAEISLDPRKGVVLADCQNHIVTRHNRLARYRAPIDTPVCVDLVFHQLEFHAYELAVFDHKLFR